MQDTGTAFICESVLRTRREYLTDHLSDRVLYEALWRNATREQASLPGKTPRAAWVHDFVGSGSAEDHQLWLRLYATEEARIRHTQQWPRDLLPPRETPAYHRDWRLPKSPI